MLVCRAQPPRSIKDRDAVNRSAGLGSSPPFFNGEGEEGWRDVGRHSYKDYRILLSYFLKLFSWPKDHSYTLQIVSIEKKIYNMSVAKYAIHNFKYTNTYMLNAKQKQTILNENRFFIPVFHLSFPLPHGSRLFI